MIKFVAILSLIAVAAASHATAWGAPISYLLIPVELSNDFRLDGSITTDGTIGPLAEENFVSWSLLIQQTVAPFQTFATSGVLPRLLSGPLMATSTSLAMPWAEPPIGSPTSGSTLIIGDLNQGPVMAEFATVTHWAHVGLDGSIPGWYSQTRIYSWIGQGGQSVGYSAPPPFPFVFAVVPEPSTMMLACAAAVGFAMSQLGRRHNR